jgi:hypothetical protein
VELGLRPRIPFAGAVAIAALIAALDFSAVPLGAFGTLWHALAYASLALLFWIGARAAPLPARTRVLTVLVTLQRKKPRLCAVSSLR